ncbi:MAG TPA: LamG domain-containing protein [Pyrinomonadaceae bacterium]|nr:LamG domain-containing protein [Pyrinomonadaceae bacterium]
MSALSAQAMTELLTVPYRRGAELMDIPVGLDAGGFTNIPAYDFREYRARYRTSRVPQAGVMAEPAIEVDPPQPKYVLYPRKNIGADEMELEVVFSSGGPPSSTVVKIPARTMAGVSFVIPLPANSDASVRLLRFRQLPLPLSGTGAENWGIVVLLGNISKLLWVLGREKDEIRQQLFDVERQRFRAFAHGSSLDQLGADLRIARFPPREHSFDGSTLALYHLNETIPANGPVTDDTVRFGLVGHAGVNAGAQSGVNGKFGTAFSFPGQAATGRIAIDHHADFNIAANRSFTAEAFIRAETIDDPLPRIVLMKRAQELAGPLLIAGWSISLGSFRGITNNVMWAVSDGANEFKIFADVNVADGKIHHVAGVIDRTARRARLYIDGEQRATAGIAALGAIANAEPIRIGGSAAANQFVGMIDEVRLSSIARSDFHPVLGEGDEAYRQRLGIFERWLLPTPGNLLSTINELVQINGQTDSFILIENDRPSVVASKVVRILPAALLAGQQIDRDGNLLSRESQVSGVAAEDSDFDELYLLRHDRPEVNYLGLENNRRMQASLKADLDALLSQLIDAGVPGRVNITKGFDAADRGLHSVGRALRLTHETLPLDRLGALAHRAGFDFVRNSGTEIYTSAAAGEKLELIIEPRPVVDTPPAGIDVFVTKAVNLHFAPETLPVNGLIDWTLIQCDAGRAHFERHPADAVTLRSPVTARRRLRLVADAPGEVTVHVEYTLARRTVACTRTLLISVETLANNQTIAANGDMQITEAAAVGSPEAVFNPIYLITSNAPVNFGAAPNNKRMQLVLEKPFMRLLALLQSIGAVTNQLQVLQAFDPAGPGLHRVGRAMRFSHAVLDVGRLGALAHRAGFGFVRRNGAEIFVAAAAHEKIEIVRASDQTPLADEVVAGTPIEVQARFSALPATGNFNWSFQQLGNGNGSFDLVLRPKVKFTPRSPGLLALNVTFLEPDPQATFPYTFEIRLKNSLNVPGTVIPKHQYDLLMNLLSYFHPIGVEVVTRNIREHVVEVQGNLLNAFPGYTYPDFRA